MHLENSLIHSAFSIDLIRSCKSSNCFSSERTFYISKAHLKYEINGYAIHRHSIRISVYNEG